MRAGVDAMLAKMVAAGRGVVAGNDNTDPRVDVLDEIFDGRDGFWARGGSPWSGAQGAANARGDTAHAAFLQSLREEMCGQSLKV